MKANIKIILSAIILTLLSGSSCKNKTNVRSVDFGYQTSGPDSGYLVIVGGNMKDTAIINRFISLAGGPDAPMIVIPTASGEPKIDNSRAAEVLTTAGARNVTVLHTYDTAVANSLDFVAPLKKARGVWFNGGRQWRLVDAYANTLTEKEINIVLARGGVIGGSSAGATILGSYLVRGDTNQYYSNGRS
jgi:cyanophycinase-like exopeptidase